MFEGERREYVPDAFANAPEPAAINAKAAEAVAEHTSNWARKGSETVEVSVATLSQDKEPSPIVSATEPQTPGNAVPAGEAEPMNLPDSAIEPLDDQAAEEPEDQRLAAK